jgi:hypothetical protein
MLLSLVFLCLSCLVSGRSVDAGTLPPSDECKCSIGRDGEQNRIMQSRAARRPCFSTITLCRLQSARPGVPAFVVQPAQLFGEQVVVTFISCNQFRQRTKTSRLLPTQAAVQTLAAFAKLNTTLLSGDQHSRAEQSRAISSPAERHRG